MLSRLNKNSLLIAYKLFGDTLFLLLLFFALALVADGLIPGIVSNHFSFLRFSVLIVFNLAALYILGLLAKVNLSQNESNKKTIIFLSIMATLLIFNSLFKLNFYLALVILFFSLITGYFLYRNFFPLQK